MLPFPDIILPLADGAAPRQIPHRGMGTSDAAVNIRKYGENSLI